jgi:integrase
MIAQSAPKLLDFATKGSKLVANRKFNFVKKAIDSLPVPTGEQRAYYYDSRTRGLALAVSPAGRKTFVLYRKVNGKPERINIGLYPDLSIEQARGEAERLNGAIAQGDNPAQQRRTIRAEDTLGTLWDRYFEEYAKHKRTADKIKGMFNLYLSNWTLRKLSGITHSDVVRLHSHIGKTRGKIVANRAVELLSSMFTQARERWNWSGENPAADIKAFPEQKRKRFLQPDELPYFFKALSEEDNEIIRDYILFSLVTGARRGNVQAARWEEINLDRGVWVIPRTKNDESVTVPLTDAALSVLERRKEQAKGSPWVFPGNGESGHLMEPKAGWARILARAQKIEREEWLKANKGKSEQDFADYKPTPSFTDLRLHDLRRTFGAYQACAGTSLPIIGESLGHKSLAATSIYARLNLDPVRQSVTRAVDTMLLAGGVAGLLGGGK